MSAPLELCCLLWANPGLTDDLARYEDTVLALVADHHGTVVSRAIGGGADGTPHEVQLFRFRDQAALDAYLADPRRSLLASERDHVVARTELFPVRLHG
ncbi:hypothetical protein AAFP30_03935 [Gordonia sp. CPCC 205515]|uniref:hypothetical protein n=1 Tax=Gordonia sp. CPCC 205515 TaxID=3140791 RepID=UPI003AF373CF